jgi:hypothetical protein
MTRSALFGDGIAWIYLCAYNAQGGYGAYLDGRDAAPQ